MLSRQRSSSVSHHQILCCLVVCLQVYNGLAILYPRESESREVKDLSGRWKFRVDDSTDRQQSFTDKWWMKPLTDSGPVIDMPVPSSYNDITQDKSIRDFIGWAWYETTFYAPISWNSPRTAVWLRVGSAHYTAIAWLNANQVIKHDGGHLPFECDVSSHLQFDRLNRLTIVVNNTLTPNTLPPGEIHHYSKDNGYPANYFTQNYEFDFFNYAGIHRPVKLYTTPTVLIKDIITTNTIDESSGTASISYKVNITDLASSVARKDHRSTSSNHPDANYNVTVVLSDIKTEETVASATGTDGTLLVNNAKLWWPVGMHDTDVAHLYSMAVHVTKADKTHAPLPTTDVYRLPIGIRTVTVEGTSFKINNRPFYFLGVGKHEDWNVRGKGFDWPMVLKDFNLLHWLGANSFRTSHYPYAEEIMQMCDEQGIVVIDECPAVGMRSANNFVTATLDHHREVMQELVARDRNHPSVVMWSVANEPASQLPQAAQYFQTVIEWTRSLDQSRPVTFVCNALHDKDVATPYVDVVSFNHYQGWYSDAGHTEIIVPRLTRFIDDWHQTRTKPIIHMEWGAGAIAGFHANPSLMYTEDYLCDVMEQHFTAFDAERNKTSPYLVGEMIWNFADFLTAQATTRAYGNRKGLLTRDRQPKWPAYVIRKRYTALRNQTKVAHTCCSNVQEDRQQFREILEEKVVFVKDQL